MENPINVPEDVVNACAAEFERCFKEFMAAVGTPMADAGRSALVLAMGYQRERAARIAEKLGASPFLVDAIRKDNGKTPIEAISSDGGDFGPRVANR